MINKFILILGILLSVNAVFAADNVSFIYINGSNYNDLKMKNWYEKRVNKLHPVLRKRFLKNSYLKKVYKEIGGLNIKESPVIFFWGYNSQKDLDFVKDKLEISKVVSSSGAYLVRSLITQCLHDAIWVQKQHNMMPVLDELNKTVKKEAQEGNRVVLYGYSAGTFVTYEYMFNKLRYINLENLFTALNADEDFLDFVKQNPRKNTCISALSADYGGLGTMSSKGHLLTNPNREMLKQNYLKLDEVTEEVCAPIDKVYGVVNFASPLPLFYSDLGDPDYELNYYNRLMVKHILENGIAMLTINFKEDPLGFPTSKNLTIKDIESKLNIEIFDPSGIIYDNSCVWSKRMFPFAHTAYWNARRSFSNAVVKSLVNGYRFQYDEKYQKKVIKRNNKKSEL